MFVIGRKPHVPFVMNSVPQSLTPRLGHPLRPRGATLYYPLSHQRSVHVSVTNNLAGTATGAFGTLLQQFLLKRFTHGTLKHTL